MAGHDKIAEFIGLFQEALQNGSFVKVSLGHYTGDEPDLKNILAKKILLKGQEKLSLTSRYKTRDIVKNYDPAEGAVRIEEALKKGFLAATLFTTGFDFVLETRKGSIHLKRGKATQSDRADTSHDRKKKRPLASQGKEWMHSLQITDSKGEVYKNAQDKFRQINKYVEILDPLIKALPSHDVLRIADMGSGKGYLTFALYDHLTHNLNIEAGVTGVEYRSDMVDLCNKIARDNNFSGLHFVQGSIENYKDKNLHVLIALHACDTATDDAIAKGIEADADLIVVAPCCHKQIRREMEKAQLPETLDFLLKHGTFLERQAEMLTDGLRSLILEYHGYNTKVFEFISDSHTPKNVMIVATKAKKSEIQKQKLLQKIAQAKNFFGVEDHHLEKILKI